MLTTISDASMISKCQEKLCGILKDKLPNKGPFRFGDPEGTKETIIYYNEEIWWCIDPRDCAKRAHVNLFGQGIPSIYSINNINLTASIPLTGINRQYQCLYVEDKIRNEYLILHRGRRFHKISKEFFKKIYKGKWVEVVDGERRESMVYLANLNKPETLISEITHFILALINIKNAVKK